MDNKSTDNHIQRDERPSTIKSIFKWASHLSGAIGFTASMWCAMITAFSLGPSVFILLNIDGYRPANFVIEKLFFAKGEKKSNRYWGGYGAEGTVDGQKEIFNLGDYVPVVINSREELTKYVQEGRKLDVMYNPDMKIHDLRVLYPEKNFHKKWEKRQNDMINTAYGPFAICMLLCFVFGMLGGVLKSCMGLLVASTFIIFMSWIPALIQLFF